jgi:hypothetical protein
MVPVGDVVPESLLVAVGRVPSSEQARNEPARASETRDETRIVRVRMGGAPFR